MFISPLSGRAPAGKFSHFSYSNLMIGARVGNWFVEAEIGRGPLGVVYRARGFDNPEQFAAVKVFTGIRDAGAVERMRAELLPLQRLDHANIVTTLDYGTHGALPFVATELVEGTDCAKLLETGRRPWREVLSIAVQAVRPSSTPTTATCSIAT